MSARLLIYTLRKVKSCIFNSICKCKIASEKIHYRLHFEKSFTQKLNDINVIKEDPIIITKILLNLRTKYDIYTR